MATEASEDFFLCDYDKVPKISVHPGHAIYLALVDGLDTCTEKYWWKFVHDDVQYFIEEIQDYQHSRFHALEMNNSVEGTFYGFGYSDDDDDDDTENQGDVAPPATRPPPQGYNSSLTDSLLQDMEIYRNQVALTHARVVAAASQSKTNPELLTLLCVQHGCAKAVLHLAEKVDGYIATHLLPTLNSILQQAQNRNLEFCGAIRDSAVIPRITRCVEALRLARAAFCDAARRTTTIRCVGRGQSKDTVKSEETKIY